MNKKIGLIGASALFVSHSLFAAEWIQYAPENFIIDTSVSVLNGESGEFVYNPENGSKLSELKWQIRNTPIIKGGLTWEAHPRVTLNANGWTTLASSGAGMDDYDWLKEGQSHWSHWSTSPTKLNFGNQFDLNATGWLIKEPAYQVGIMAGYQETRFSWMSKGGHYNYNNGTQVGDFERNSRAIGYQQNFKVPYIGLAGKYRYRDFDVVAQLKYGLHVESKDQDEHYARSLSFKEKATNGNYYSGTVSAGYYVTPQARLYTEVSWTRFSEGKGSSSAYDHSTGESDYSGGHSAGLQNYNYTVGAGIQYRF